MKELKGVYTIPPAVYHPNMDVNYEGIRKCVQFCLDCNAHGIVIPVYATEYFVLSNDERKKILEVTVKEVNGKVPVVAGVTSSYVKESVDLTKHAVANGADAIIAAPPHLMKVSQEELYDYYKRINEVSTVPIMIQHISPPLGTIMNPGFLMKLVNELENISYVKEESPRSNSVITKLFELEKNQPQGNLLGIMGGNGSRSIIEEYDRGICGTMPPSQFTDVVVDIWELLENGKRKEAYDLHTKVLPALLYGSTYPIISYKHILKRRGVVDFAGCRPAGWPKMDEKSFKMLDLIMESVDPFLKVK